MYKFHMTVFTALQFFQHPSLIISKHEFYAFIFFIIVIIIGQIFISFLAGKLTAKISTKKIIRILLSNLIVIFSCYFTLAVTMFSGNNLLAQQTISFPMYEQFYRLITQSFGAKYGLSYYAENKFYQRSIKGSNLNYPQQEISCSAKKKYSVIILVIDSLRFDSISKEKMPNLFKRRNSFTQFNNHWSGGNSTQAGLFSLFYSLPPNYWSATINNKISPILNTKLLDAGYSLNAFWSSGPLYDKNILLNYLSTYSAIEDIHQLPARNDQETINQLSKFINIKKKQPYFIQILLDGVHGYCSDSKIPTIFKPIAKNCSRWTNSRISNVEKYYNRYKNSLANIDAQLQKIMMVFDEKKIWQNTIVIITSDHGEEFDDNKQGYFGHSSNYTKYQLKVPMLVHWPQKKTKNIFYKTTHYDLVPTLIDDLLGCKIESSKYSIGKNIFNPKQTPFIIAGSYVNSAVITDQNIFLLASNGAITTQDKKARILSNKPHDFLIIKKTLELMRKFYF